MKEHSVDTKRHFFGRSLGSYIKDHFSIYFGNYIIKLTRKLDNRAETNKVTKQINTYRSTSSEIEGGTNSHMIENCIAIFEGLL